MILTPVYKDLVLYQGADFSAPITLVYSANGSFINISSFVFTSQAKRSYFTPNVVSNISMTITDAPNGNVLMSMTAANTANIPAGKLVYDVLMFDTSNNTSRIQYGILTINPGVTNITPPNSGIPAL